MASATGQFTPGSPQALQYLTSLLAQSRVDPRAANAVFGAEGASGGIGDGGHAFGPGQFNDAGGVWTGRYPGMTPEQKNMQAWSQPGLQELARHVASVAGGLQGPEAIHAIVGDTQVGGHYTGFERPANESGEIARALAAYGQPGATSSYAPAGIEAQFTPRPARSALAPKQLGAIVNYLLAK